MRILISFLFIIATTYSLSCDCVPEVEMSLEFHRTQYISVGKVVSISESEDGNEFLVVVEIKHDFKGDKAGSTVVICTNQSPKACGYTFKVGREYLIYSNRHERVPKHWKTSVCSRTVELSSAENDLIFITRELNLPMNKEWEKQFKD